MDFAENALKKNLQQLEPREALLFVKKLYQELGTNLFLRLIQISTGVEETISNKIANIISNPNILPQEKLGWLTLFRNIQLKCSEETKQKVLEFLLITLIEERQPQYDGIVDLLIYFVEKELFYSATEMKEWISGYLWLLSKQWIYIAFDIYGFQPALPLVLRIAQENTIVSEELLSFFEEWGNIIEDGFSLAETKIGFLQFRTYKSDHIPSFLENHPKEVYQKIVHHYLQEINKFWSNSKEERRVFFFLALLGDHIEKEAIPLLCQILKNEYFFDSILYILKKMIPTPDELFKLLLDMRKQCKGKKLCEEIFRMHLNTEPSQKLLPEILSFFEDVIRNEDYEPYCLFAVEIAGKTKLLSYPLICSVFMDILKNTYLSPKIILKVIETIGDSQPILEESVSLLESFLEKENFSKEAAVALIQMGKISEKAVIVLRDNFRIQDNAWVLVFQKALSKAPPRIIPLLLEALDDSDPQQRIEKGVESLLEKYWNFLSLQDFQEESWWIEALNKLIQLKNQEIKAYQSASRLLDYIQENLLRLLQEKSQTVETLAKKTTERLSADEFRRKTIAKQQGCVKGFESNDLLVQLKKQLDLIHREK